MRPSEGSRTSFVGCFSWVTNSPQETIKGRRRSCAVASGDCPAIQAILRAGAAISSSKPGAVQATFKVFCLDLALVLQLLFESGAAIDPRNFNIKKKKHPAATRSRRCILGIHQDYRWAKLTRRPYLTTSIDFEEHVEHNRLRCRIGIAEN